MTSTIFASIAITLSGPAGCLVPSQPNQDLPSAHVTANVPPDDTFEPYLVRDLTAYFVERGISAPVVTFEMLRDGPTQSGMAYPKYYVWAKATSSDGSVTEGVARVAAIDQTGFEITDFVSRDDVLAQPNDLDLVVPAALVSVALERARQP